MSRKIHGIYMVRAGHVFCDSSYRGQPPSGGHGLGAGVPERGDVRQADGRDDVPCRGQRQRRHQLQQGDVVPQRLGAVLRVDRNLKGKMARRSEIPVSVGICGCYIIKIFSAFIKSFNSSLIASKSHVQGFCYRE